MQELDVGLDQEDYAAGLLGVTLWKESKTVLIQHVIEAVGLDDGIVKGKFTP